MPLGTPPPDTCLRQDTNFQMCALTVTHADPKKEQLFLEPVPATLAVNTFNCQNATHNTNICVPFGTLPPDTCLRQDTNSQMCALTVPHADPKKERLFLELVPVTTFNCQNATHNSNICMKLGTPPPGTFLRHDTNFQMCALTVPHANPKKGATIPRARTLPWL